MAGSGSKRRKLSGEEDDGGVIIEDPRFKRAHSDPRFHKLRRSRLKVPIDSRFERMFTDKEFIDPFSVDKRGRPIKQKKNKSNILKRYYKIGDEEEGKEDRRNDNAEKQKQEEVLKQDVESSSSEVEEEQSETEDSSSVSSSSSESDSDVEDAVDTKEEKIATTETETKRLALVNMDWSCIKASDLFMLFNSFLPKGGQIVSLVVYPSQFGLEEMRKEEVKGPSVFNNEDDEEEVDMEKLREYEKSKLRYYFAVITCDSVNTASVLYKHCDGIEFERTSNILDLRYIPDDMEFTVEPRDSASEVVPGFEAPDFQTRALQLSNVKITWDDDEPVRTKTLRRKLNADQLNEMDFQDYLASEEDDEGEDEIDEETKKKKIDKFRSLLLEDAEPQEGSRAKDVDLEITFPSGLDELSKKYMEQKSKKEKDETVWEAQLRKQREKKKHKKKVDAQVSTKPVEDDGFDDPFFNSDQEGETVNSESEENVKKVVQKSDAEERKKKREEREKKKLEEDRSRAELELLLLDDQDGTAGATKGYNLQKKKNKKSKEKNTEKLDVISTADFNDPRFSQLFNSHHFAIDPTDPQFRRSASKLRVIAEMQQRRFQKNEGGEAKNEMTQATEGKKENLELSSLVRSLKRKSQVKT